MELWRECAVWLHRFKLFPSSDPALSKHGQIKDLVALLRDGVILCQLVHCLDPDSVDMTRVLLDPPESGTGDFLCRHNIFLFIHAVIHNFQLSIDDQVFQPEDLYQCKDLGRVLETLSVLSNCPKLRRSGIPGFPKKEKQLAKKLRQERREYETLNKIYGEAEAEYIYDSFNRSSSSSHNNTVLKDLDQSHYEDIYQTIFPPKQPRLSLDISFGKKSKRAAPMQELVETEDKYLENLIMVRDVFRESLPGMSPPHKSLVFFQLDELISLHSDLLFGLTQKKADIGAVFLDHMERIGQLYGQYCINLPVAMETLEKLQAGNATLRKQIFDCQLRAKPSTFPMSSHLVIPFQRFLKYHLLLKEILKHTPTDHPDHLSISKASDEMLKIGMDVNETKREHEDCERQAQTDVADIRLIENVRQSIKLMQLPGNSRLTDFGRLRKAGDVTVYSERGKVADYAFLFDMVMVLCHKPRWMQHRYRYREAIRVKDYYVEPVLSPEKAPNTEVFSVRLFKRIDARKPPVTLIVKTLPERDSWFHSILTAMDAVSPSENASQGHVLQLCTLQDVTDCFHCGKRLNGTFFQGYRCLRCQVTLHKACIGACACIEVGGVITRSESVQMPIAVPDSLERSDSTLSLAPPSGQHERRSSVRLSQQAQQDQINFQREMETMPYEAQPWYAGQLAGKIASDRLESLPIGTFLIRQRANGDFALMLKTPERPRGVKAMVINRDVRDGGSRETYFFSGARKFDSIQKLVAYYRTRDLTENFDYPSLKGVPLKTPYKSL